MNRPIRPLLAIVIVLSLVAGCSGNGDSSGGGLADLLAGVTSTTGSAADGDDQPGTSEGDASPTIMWDGNDGTMQVPLDHDDPDGATIELALVRRPANDPDDSLGPLLLNPGGPGASGNELVMLAGLILPSEVLDRFDIIGFDPRGVADSTPVTCGDHAFMDTYTAVDPVPDSPEETAEAEAVIEQFADNCVAESGELLPHINTVATARDMDLIRQALGAEQITYLGFSYGTFLGATYIEMFPERVRAAVLDGAYSRSLTGGDMAAGQAEGFERSIDAFLEWCTPQRCDLASGGDPADELFGLLDAIDAKPLPTSDGRQLTVGLAWTGVIMAMYSPGLWPLLDRALVLARDNGDGSRLLGLADQYNSRSPDGEFDNSQYAFNVISCGDEPAGSTETDAEVVARVLAVASRVGPVFVSLPSPCDHLDLDTGAPSGPFSAPDAPPLLVIATTGDPATPYQWGVTLAEELETSTLLTVEGDAHTAYGGGITCVNDIVDAYLLELELPPEGTTCKG
ncbi:MAG: alpha/beta fold hydrolase [Acidimicrobiia bacterium]|nr:alpha/beta fold hydrolase [Acidimicrobiia bacterium]